MSNPETPVISDNNFKKLVLLGMVIILFASLCGCASKISVACDSAFGVHTQLITE